MRVLDSLDGEPLPIEVVTGPGQGDRSDGARAVVGR